MATTFYFEEMFRPHIKGVLSLPEDMENYNPDEYPHWQVFKTIHLGNVFDISDLPANAEIINSFNEEEIKKVTIEQLVQKGLFLSSGQLI